MKQEHVQKTGEKHDHKLEADEELGVKDLTEEGQELTDEMDEILDEIDEVLEENAEEFIAQFVQKGGE